MQTHTHPYYHIEIFKRKKLKTTIKLATKPIFHLQINEENTKHLPFISAFLQRQMVCVLANTSIDHITFV